MVASKVARNRLSMVEALALDKVQSGVDARAEVGPGRYEVDFTVRVHGTLSVGDDYEMTPRYDPPVIAALCYLLGEVADRDEIAELFPKMLAKADTADAQDIELMMVEYGIKVETDLHKAKMQQGMSKKVCNGKVSAVLFGDLIRGR